MIGIGLVSGFVYVLQSERNGCYYVGSTTDLVRRYWRHAAGQVTATARLQPWQMVGWREYADATLTRQVEWAVKQKKGRAYVERWLEGGWEPKALE